MTHFRPMKLEMPISAPVTVARRAGQVYAFGELLLWYFINDMIIPGSMYWNVAVAGAKDADKDLEGIEIMKYAVARDKLFFTPPQEK